MSYTKSNGEYADTDAVILQPSASKSATYQGAWIEIGDKSCLRLKLDVTVATAGTLDVTVETADDAAGTNSRTLSTFAQKSTVTSEKKSFSGCDRFARVNVSIATGPFTFSVIGEAA